MSSCGVGVMAYFQPSCELLQCDGCCVAREHGNVAVPHLKF